MSDGVFGVELVSQVLESSRASAARSQYMDISPAVLGHRLGIHQNSAITEPSPEQLDAVLRERESVRSFSTCPVPAASIGRAIDAGITADRDLWLEENRAGVDLELILVAWSVEKLEQGVYVWENGSFRRINDPPERRTRGSVALQWGLQSAPALLIAAGNLLASCARHGDHGHRMLMCRAGVACHTAWLSAIADGLAGALFAGFQPAAARHILGTSKTRRQLFALALGNSVADVPVP